MTGLPDTAPQGSAAAACMIPTWKSECIGGCFAVNVSDEIAHGIMRSGRGHAPAIQEGSAPKPAILTPIVEAIEKSRYVLDLPEDWDEAGGRPIEAATWARATDLLSETAAAIGAALPVPRIGPCSDGSIDLYWTTPTFTLLINVHAAEGAKLDY